MRTLLKTAAITALITGFANSANAFEAAIPTALFETAAQITEQVKLAPAVLPANAKIAVARLDGGRFIPAPHSEEFDWELLDKRTHMDIEVMQADEHFKYLPEIAFQGVDTDNKIDEIRITAAAEGHSHVIVYGVGPDAYWASFGGKALRETGLTVKANCASWGNAKAKALLVNTHTGEVLGAATADNIEFNIGELADNVGELITELSPV